MKDTLTNGRVDIVEFANGGWEIIGQQASEPPVDLENVMPEIAKFVSRNRELSNPEKYTAIYSVKDGILKISWMQQQDELPDPTAGVDPVALINEAKLDRERQMAVTAEQEAAAATVPEADPDNSTKNEVIDVSPEPTDGDEVK